LHIIDFSHRPVDVYNVYNDVFNYFSHRPVDVYNVYNQVQVKMLMKEADCDGIPPFEDVFRDDEDETFQVHIQHHRVPCMRYEFINVPFKSFDDLYTVWKWSQAL